MGKDSEKSVGAVVYKKGEAGGILFLLVYSAKNRQWGFPKGHVEENETEIETAKREIFEETGIRNIEFAGNFRCSDSYKTVGVLPHTKGRIIVKNVIYYLCFTDSAFIDRQNSEIERCRWFLFEEAESVLKYEAQKKILKKANDFLHGGKDESCIGK